MLTALQLLQLLPVLGGCKKRVLHRCLLPGKQQCRNLGESKTCQCFTLKALSENKDVWGFLVVVFLFVCFVNLQSFCMGRLNLFFTSVAEPELSTVPGR